MSHEAKIEFYLLRKSAKSFAEDLNEFVKEIPTFNIEQLYAVSSYCDCIRDHMIAIKAELEKRLDKAA